MLKKLFCCSLIFVLGACSDSGATDPQSDEQPTGDVNVVESTPASVEEGLSETERNLTRFSLDEVQEDLGIPVLSVPWTGDLDGMVERRVIRVLTVYGLGKYYIEDGQEKGITYELFKMLEQEINKKYNKKHIRIHVVFVPVARDELIPGLLKGRGDIAAAGLTITPEREQLIDFTNPLSRELSEILVTGPSGSGITSMQDLSGQEVYVRASSSYRSSLEAVNSRFREQGIEEITIREISEYLEDEDLLEMVNNGSLQWAIVDDYQARNWATVFENLVLHDDIQFRVGGQLGFAIRKDSPELMSFLNEFVRTHRQGTLKGNILVNRYVHNFDWSKNALGTEDYERFLQVVDTFQKFGDQYGFDYLIVTAQGFQESRLDQNARSHAGAVGIMQLLPSTAADPNVGIPDISDADSNIHAGVRYLDFIRNRYFKDSGMDEFNQTLFAMAAYNAGPARIAKLRNKAEQQGYDPNLWFDNVEIIAAREIGRETVQYVSNILKYYVVYRLSVIRTLQRLEERKLHQVDQPKISN